MSEYRVTFGSQYGAPEYGADPHPRVGYLAHKDGWFTIVADTEERARDLTVAILGTAWSNIYTAVEHREDEHLYPRGELLRIVDPAAQQEDRLLTTVSEQTLVRVWANGTGELAIRAPDGGWLPPTVLVAAP